VSSFKFEYVFIYTFNRVQNQTNKIPLPTLHLSINPDGDGIKPIWSYPKVGGWWRVGGGFVFNPPPCLSPMVTGSKGVRVDRVEGWGEIEQIYICICM
jgi:hypothetical protein